MHKIEAGLRRLPFTVAALLSAGMAACGGGSGGDATPTTSTVFAAPSGALCAQRDSGGVCEAPTSSKASTEQLLALQRGETDQVRFTVIGPQGDLYQRFDAVAAGSNVSTSQSNYTLLEQPVLFGRNQVVDDKATYAYDSTDANSQFRYVSGSDRVTLGLFQGDGTPFAMRRTVTYERSLAADGSGSIGVTDWGAYFGPLTDRNDAPTDAEVEYVGSVGIRAGDGSPVQVGSRSAMGHFVSGGCAITLKLDTTHGTITTTDASCTDPQTQAVISFSLARLTLSGSRVSGQLGGEAIISIDGPSGGLVSVEGIEHTKAQFSSSRIAGAVYGRAAAGIVIAGSDPQGMFTIVAKRK